MNIILHGPILYNFVEDLRALINISCQITAYATLFEDKEFLKRVGDADVLVTMEFPGLKVFPKSLKLIQVPGGGTDHLNFSKIPTHVAVCTAPQHEDAIVEYILMSMLVFLKKMKKVEKSFRRGSWEMGARCNGPLHNQIMRKNVGIIGFGRIGKSLAKKLKIFGANIYVCNRSQVLDENIDKFFSLKDIHDMVATVDFIVVAIALTPETTNILNADSFQFMKSNAVIINIARGGCIEEESLFKACKSKKIAGAALDVWYNYPRLGDKIQSPSKYPFSKLDNVIMTPHISAWTEESLSEKIKIIADNIIRLSKNEELQNLIKR